MNKKNEKKKHFPRNFGLTRSRSLREPWGTGGESLLFHFPLSLLFHGEIIFFLSVPNVHQLFSRLQPRNSVAERKRATAWKIKSFFLLPEYQENSTPFYFHVRSRLCSYWVQNYFASCKSRSSNQSCKMFFSNNQSEQTVVCFFLLELVDMQLATVAL